ncbi:MAG TPA: hypothetical protein VN887_03725, partial [Candidatus Angelobacter sp.]|nr:hypothetical protein [Candidatus Angelobacter sp.]
MKGRWQFLLFAAVSLFSAKAEDWQVGVGYRYAQLPVHQTSRVGFTLQPLETTGIAFTNSLSEQRHLTNQILLNGSGVAAGDVDGDGRCDLFFCHLGGPSAL